MTAPVEGADYDRVATLIDYTRVMLMSMDDLGDLERLDHPALLRHVAAALERFLAASCTDQIADAVFDMLALGVALERAQAAAPFLGDLPEVVAFRDQLAVLPDQLTVDPEATP